jgi:hypothetical protein
MPLAAHDSSKGAAGDKTTRPSWVAAPEDAADEEEEDDDENPSTTRRLRQATTVTRTFRLVLAAVAVGSLRSFLTDNRRQSTDGGSVRGGVIGLSLVGPPRSDDASGSSALLEEGTATAANARDGGGSGSSGARGSVPPSVGSKVEPPSSGKDDETTYPNSSNISSSSSGSSSASHVVVSPRDDDDEEPSSSALLMCSCLHSFSNRTCCARTVLRAHKFGHVLAAEWFDKLRRSDNLDLTLTIDPTYLSPPSSSDYRHVVFVRNYTDAFVSGYLYHKTGRECWLDPDGYPNGKPRSRQFNLYWGAPVKIAQHRHSRFGVIPPRHNRSLCEYLADENEQDGMKVYVAVALERWYSGLEEYLEHTKMARIVPGSSFGNRSYFVCLEDASDPRYEKDWYDAAMDHLYPGSAVDGGGRYAHPFPKRAVAKAKGNAQNQHAAYHGSHATSHDPDLRERLTRLVSELDRDVFDHRIAAVDAMIGCAGSGAGRTAPKEKGSSPRAPH